MLAPVRGVGMTPHVKQVGCLFKNHCLLLKRVNASDEAGNVRRLSCRYTWIISFR
jgi:hypothetical protein